MKTNCQLFPQKNHQSQLTMIRNLQLFLLRRHFELSKNRQSYILPLKTRNCQLFQPKTHQSELTMRTATLLEEMLRTMQEPPVTHPSLPPFSSMVVAWICEFCDCQWPPSQKRCGNCKRWKGGKTSMIT